MKTLELRFTTNNGTITRKQDLNDDLDYMIQVKNRLIGFLHYIDRADCRDVEEILEQNLTETDNNILVWFS